MTRTTMALVAATLLAGCGGGTPAAAPPTPGAVTTTVAAAPPGAVTTVGLAQWAQAPRPTCASLAGKTLTAEVVRSGCSGGPDGLTVYTFAEATCVDERVLARNDMGWGYVGGPYALHPGGNATTKGTPDRARLAAEAASCGG